MTCAHRCLLTQLMLALDALAAVDPDAALRIKRGPLPDDELGAIDYETNEITIARNATTPEFRTTLTHELVHLRRGPCPANGVEEDEAQVEAATARLLVPRDHLPDMLDTADPERIAEDLVIDLPIARLGIKLAALDEQQGTGPEGL